MKRTLQSTDMPAGPLFAVGAVALIAATYGLARLGYGLFLPAFSAAFSLSPTIGGLLASTMITLLVVPVIYTLFEEGWKGLRAGAKHA